MNVSSKQIASDEAPYNDEIINKCANNDTLT